MALQSIPEVVLSSSNAKAMPVLGLGTGEYPLPAREVVVKAVLEAIELGYRMFDTASAYKTEEALGEAISQALNIGLIKSRDEVFITSKIWCSDNHGDRVLPALQKTLQNMKLEYLDQYLIHWPVSLKPGADTFHLNQEDVVPMDIKSVWTAMEECQTLGLTKSIGVSNFTCKKLANILDFAKIPPAVNQEMAPESIPAVTLSSVDAKPMPVLGLGTGGYPPAPPEVVIKAVLDAIELGYRMFDTASFYQTEEAVGEAISQAISLGLIKSRDEVFLTSKFWCTDNHGDRILPALKKTLQNMKLEYLDQYLIHWPVSLKPDANTFQLKPEDVVPMDIKSVWTAMEECQTLGLTKSIGVSNFSCKKLADILAFAKIPPAINQVEMNPAWQQGKLKEFCQSKGIKIAAFSPLGAAGAFWGTKGVLESEVLNEIAKSKGKSVAQVALRWAYEQGVVVVMKSFNKDRLKQNQEIFDWELSAEESKKISEIPQSRANRGELFVFETGPIKSVEELWDGEL